MPRQKWGSPGKSLFDGQCEAGQQGRFGDRIIAGKDCRLGAGSVDRDAPGFWIYVPYHLNAQPQVIHDLLSHRVGPIVGRADFHGQVRRAWEIALRRNGRYPLFADEGDIRRPDGVGKSLESNRSCRG